MTLVTRIPATRRRFLITASAAALTLLLPASRLIAAPPTSATDPRELLLKRIAQLEKQAGGRLGFSLRRAGSASSVAQRGSERFLMCSTFKVALAACVLQRVDQGLERLQRAIPVARGDIVSHSPLTEPHVGGAMAVADLCAATVTVSDNAAANLLLRTLGGPSGLTAFMRAAGDPTSRLDRTETALNIAAPDTDWDTTTPDAMTGLLASVLYGPVLSVASRAQLRAWMAQASTGKDRLRSAMPESWPQGDKTGTGPTTTNDIAWFQPAGQSPWLLAVYYADGKGDAKAQNGVFADVARAVVEFVNN